MSLIFIGKGTTTLGVTRRDNYGNVTKTTARWDYDPNGGSVVVGKMNPDTMEPEGTADIYGDWDAARYLAKVLEHLSPSRRINIPDLRAIVIAAEEEDDNCLCKYCQSFNCRDCIIQEWKDEVHENDQE